jgi:hypothetical protein
MKDEATVSNFARGVFPRIIRPYIFLSYQNIWPLYLNIEKRSFISATNSSYEKWET